MKLQRYEQDRWIPTVTQMCGNTAALCHAGSSVWSCHFSSHGQHHSGRRKDAFFCEKHTWQGRRPWSQPLHRLTLNLPSTTTPVSTLYPTFFPSLHPRPPRGDKDLCLGQMMSLLVRFQSSEQWTGETVSVCLQCLHAKAVTVFVFRSGKNKAYGHVL